VQCKTRFTQTALGFDDEMCDFVVEFHLEIASFYFGFPDENLILLRRSL
jgi:hypothetical protein